MAGAVCIAPVAHAQPLLGVTTTEGGGECAFVAFDRPEPCTPRFSHRVVPGGRILLMVVNDNANYSFVAEAEKRVAPDERALSIVRLQAVVGIRFDTHDVVGRCTIRTSPDAALWHKIACRVVDQAGQTTRLSFAGDGRPVEINPSP